jgi:hypothetical protein
MLSARISETQKTYNVICLFYLKRHPVYDDNGLGQV